mmetsp:Transcript_13288/g.19934  ORF Transcript_13288/g.19934 Transcript_13288/m.19934 type:complete len:224 (+) Transcript_13288:104-775(+)
MIGNQQMRLCNTDLTEYVYHRISNTRISYIVDLSKVKKGWLGTLYTCDFTGLKPPAYLDAQTSDSRVEFDVMEANRIAWHSATHKSGDRGGSLIMGIGGTIMQSAVGKFICDQTNSMDVTELFGPGKYIDSNERIYVSYEHHLDTVRVELKQGDRIIYQECSNGPYLSQCKLNEQLHTIVMSLWTGDVGWCDDDLPFYDDSHIDSVEYTISNLCIDDLSPSGV